MFWLLNLSSQNPLWSQFGNNSPVISYVDAMFVDPIDNKLYVGGPFTYLGGIKCRGAARWNGTNWDSLAGGFEKNSVTNFSGRVKKILRYNNKIYYFGTFEDAGNYLTKGMAIWNSATDTWDSTGAYPNSYVLDADVYNDTLYICGTFSKIGNLTTYGAAKFDGTNWYPLSFPHPSIAGLTGIRAYKNKVYAIGSFYNFGYSQTAEWSYANGWQPSLGLQGDVNKALFGLERIDTLLYFYGRFTHLSYMYSPCVAAYSGTKLYGFGEGTGMNNYSTIQRLKKIDNTIYALGTFDNAGSMFLPVSNLGIAELHNNQWCIYGQSFDNAVTDMVKYNSDKLIGGGFNSIDGDSVRKVAKWIGGSYTYSCNGYTIAVTGQNEIENNFADLKMFPIPANQMLTIETSLLSENESLTLNILNDIGQVIREEEIIIRNKQAFINTNDLANGFYLLKLKRASTESIIKKIVVSH